MNFAQFFDIFGLIVFGFLLWVSSRIVKKKKLSENIGWTIAIISIMGLIVDGISVWSLLR